MNEPGVAAAFAAGLLSFVSPCVLPLVPAYLSFITGAGAGVGARAGSGSSPARAARARVFAASLAFSAGFTAAFTVLGVVFSGSALFFGQFGAGGSLGLIGGIIVVLLGLNMLFEPFAFLARDTRIVGKIAAERAKKRAANPGSANATLFGAFTLGLAFAAGWSPCIGPILASILIFASREGQVLKATGLLATYSLGFALPFLATGLFFDRLKPLLDWLKRRGTQVRVASGILLVVFGIAMAMGSLGNLSAIATRAGQALTALASRAPLAVLAADLALILAATAPAALALARRARHASTTASSAATAGGHARPSALAIAWLALCAIALVLEVSGVLPLWKIAGLWLGFAGI